MCILVEIHFTFRAFRIGFTITAGLNYTDELQNVNSRRYQETVTEILAQVRQNSDSVILNKTPYCKNLECFECRHYEN